MDFRGQVWTVRKRVWKIIFLVWKKVRIWRTGRHTRTKNSQEYPRLQKKEGFTCLLSCWQHESFCTREGTLDHLKTSGAKKTSSGQPQGQPMIAWISSECFESFFTSQLWLVRISNIFILRFTVALPLIFPCVIMIIFCSNYLTEGVHSL